MSSNPTVYTDGSVTYTLTPDSGSPWYDLLNQYSTLVISYADGSPSQTFLGVANAQILTAPISGTLGTLINALNFTTYFVPPGVNTAVVFGASALSVPTLYVSGSATIANVASLASAVNVIVTGPNASFTAGAGVVSALSGLNVTMAHGGTFSVGLGVASLLSATAVNFDPKGSGGTFVIDGGNNVINLDAKNALLNLSGLTINNFGDSTSDRFEFKNVQGTITSYQILNSSLAGTGIGSTQTINLFDGSTQVGSVTIGGACLPAGNYSFGQSGSPLAIQTVADGSNSDVYINPTQVYNTDQGTAIYSAGGVTYTVSPAPSGILNPLGVNKNLTITFANGSSPLNFTNLSPDQVITSPLGVTLGTALNVLNFTTYFVPPGVTTTLTFGASALSYPTVYVGGNVTVASAASLATAITYNVTGSDAILHVGSGLFSALSGTTVNLLNGGSFEVGIGLISALSSTTINFDQQGTGGTFIVNGGNNLINFGGQNALLNLSGTTINNFNAASGDRIEFQNVQGTITGYTITNNTLFPFGVGPVLSQTIKLYDGSNNVCGLTVNGNEFSAGNYTFGQSGPLAMQTQPNGSNTNIFIDPTSSLLAHVNQTITSPQLATGITQGNTGGTISLAPNVALTVGNASGIESVANSQDVINIGSASSLIDQGGLDNSSYGTINIASSGTLSVGSTDTLNAINNSVHGTIVAGNSARITDAGGLDNSNSGTISLAGTGTLSVSSTAPLNAINNSSYGTITAGSGEQITDAGGLDNSNYGTISLAGTGTLSVSSTDPLNAINNSSYGTITAGSGEKITDAGGLNNSTDGVLNLNGASASIVGEVDNDGNGTINIDNGSTLTAGSIYGGSGTISFQGTGNTLSVTPNPSLDFGNLGTITGFTTGDTINLSGTQFGPGASLVSNGSVDTIMNNGTTVASFSTVADETIAIAGGPNGVLEIICFLAGTHIATPKGEVEVQTLRAGDLVLTASGAARPVRWLGQSTVSTRFADPVRSAPIRITAGALGENLPVRDLLVSPAHAMFINDVLVEAGALVNGTTIRRETISEETFVYYHVELEAHDLIVAEGAACESFIDNVDRMNFDNWSEHDTASLTAPIVEMAYPRAKSARQVPQAVRQQLDERASLLVTSVVAA